jgi:hypothetical protein
MKLELFKCQLQDQNLTHFQRMLKLQSAEYAVAVISQLQTEFQERFQDFRAQERTLNVVTNPFSVNVMRLQGTTKWKSLTFNVTQTWKSNLMKCLS